MNREDMKIVIIGGVAAGMSAAARARRLDEHAVIIVIERSQYVSFANCGLPYHVGEVIENRDALVLQTPESLAESLNLDVRIGHEARHIKSDRQNITVNKLNTNEDYQLTYDKLVICPGAKPTVPNLPGVNHPSVFTLRNIEDMDKLKATVDGSIKSAVIIGGGYIGIEMAENLHHRGIEVSLIEIADQVMPLLDQEMSRDIQYHLEYHGINLKLSTSATGFKENNQQLDVLLDTGESISTDMVLLAVGVRPDISLLDGTGIAIGSSGGILVNKYMQTNLPNIYAAGDAVEVSDTITGEPSLIALAGPANRQGRIVADHIFGRASSYSTTQGTAIVKVFEMTAGGTGASEKTLKRNNIPYRKIYIHPTGHASYYPGTNSMHIKLLFKPDDGKLLGVQIVGYDGVDKRIDVFSVALRAGLTVFDLEHLELTYAPPYGSAKDPVNMAGFVGSNLLNGDIEFWYAEDYENVIENALLVDVRSSIEYDAWHIDGAVNIPLGKLRSSLNKLPKDKIILLYCRVGFRSYLAYRVLAQSGVKQVKTLAGGSKTFCSFHRTPLCTGKPGMPFVAHAEERLAENPQSVNSV
ncbi:FAD-dependent oxidoreductase [Methylophaga sp. OBS4]|uniref:FAD-dependent oxidoreductase n=1 Tax=Methylophaga sp. OBS4 TaxID=2991935 RepID=UPI00224FB542|nr:FAD-dependent oxidoreductase [Methylophaga sp. OBS4]MCX4188523.1 FAD-dependent oxidoreductase [Methylophaga sp. OBS4]